MNKVILSASILLEDGIFHRKTITFEEALEFSKDSYNYVLHDTVKMLGVEPAIIRESCPSYIQALILQPKQRLKFGKEYSLEEIEEIGVDFILITKMNKGE